MVESTDRSDLVEAVQAAAEGLRLSRDQADTLLEKVFMPVIENTFKRHHFFEEVTGLAKEDLVGELWAFSSTPGPQTSKSLWRKSLDSAAVREHSDLDAHSYIKAYLCLSCKRHVISILMKKSPAEAMVSLVSEAFNHSKQIQLSKHPKGIYHSSIRPISKTQSGELPNLDETILENLLPKLSIPVPKSRRSTLVNVPFPTPKQVLDVTLQILNHHPGELLISDLVDFLFKAFQIPRQAVNVSLENDPNSEDFSKERRVGGQPHTEELKNFSTSSDHIRAEKDALIPQFARDLLDKIEKDDRVPIIEDDPSSGGKLARLFLDFVIWQSAVRIDDSSVRFGYEVYSEMTSTPVSTLNDRYKRRFVPLLQTFCVENRLNADDVRSIFNDLRQKFSARKPEKFADPDFK